MIIELMLMLIALGAGIFFVAWTNTRRRKKDLRERLEVADSTGKLKQELERTANEIIGRMENHVTHLEKILDESDRSRTQLEGRVVELKKLLKKSEGQSGEIRDLLARLEDAGAEVDTMQRKMDNIERKLNLAMTTPLPVQQPVTIPQVPTQIIQPVISPPIMPITPAPVARQTPTPIPQTQPIVQQQPVTQAPPVVQSKPVTKVTTPPATPLNPLGSITMSPITHSSPPISNDNAAKDFDKILEESISAPVKLEKNSVAESQPARESIIISPENHKPVKAVEADPVKIEATRKKLTEASAKMASNPPDEIDDEKISAQTLRKRNVKARSRDVRKAALDAIREAEKSSSAESKPVEETRKKSSVEKKSRLERRELKLETTDSSIIKEMLLSGMSIEEISRETGLGRGAIELVQELTRRQLK